MIEPSEDAVEAAARVILEFMTHKTWQQASHNDRILYRMAARNALTAANRVKDLPPALPQIVRGRERYSDFILPAYANQGGA